MHDTMHSGSARELPDWHSTFSANADVTCNTVHARGVLDLLTVELLRGTVGVLISAGQVDVTIDLQELSHIDHSGVLLIGGISHDLAYRSGSLTLINANPSVQRALETIDLRVAGRR
jgi:anti-anti-sigma factor